MEKKWFVVSVALCAALVGCASTRGAGASSAVSGKKPAREYRVAEKPAPEYRVAENPAPEYRVAEKAAQDYRVVDWKNRGLGEAASPEWLLPAARGDWKRFKADWSVDPGKVLKLGVASNARQNVAMTIADVQYAARLAYELKQHVLTRAGISLGNDGEFDAVNNAATQTQVTIAGHERLTDFWQKVETLDDRGRKITRYDYYVVYACDVAIWDQFVAKYLFEVAGQLPEKKTQATIAGMFKEIDAATRNETPVSEAQFKRELAARQAALAQGGISADEQRAAYRSKDPVKAAAAGTTKADENYIAALSALANQ